MLDDNNFSYEKSPFIKVFLFLRNRELSVKGVFLDDVSLLLFRWKWGVVNYDDRLNMPIEEGEKILSLYCLTQVIHIDDPSHLYGRREWSIWMTVVIRWKERVFPPSLPRFFSL